MTLYEIDQAIIDTYENAVDQETGEIIDAELWDAYDQLQEDREQKIENIGLYIKNLESDADAIKEEAKKLTLRAKLAENKAERLRGYLQHSLAGEKFNTPRLSVSYRKSQKVEVDHVRLMDIPDNLLRYKDPEPDKTAIKEILKSGGTVPGCELVDSVSMIIK